MCIMSVDYYNLRQVVEVFEPVHRLQLVQRGDITRHNHTRNWGKVHIVSQADNPPIGVYSEIGESAAGEKPK